MVRKRPKQERWSLESADLGQVDELVEYLSRRVGYEQLAPEKRLYFAVLWDAVVLLRYKKPTRARAEAARWILADRVDHPYAYAAICEELGINAAAFRQRLVQYVGPLEELTGWTVQPRWQKKREA